MDEEQGRALAPPRPVRQQDRWIEMQGSLLHGHGTPRGIVAVNRLTKFSKGFHPVVAEGSGRGFADEEGQAP